MKSSSKMERFPQLYRSAPNLLVISTDLAGTATTKAQGMTPEMADQVLSSLDRLRFYRSIIDLGPLSVESFPVLLQGLSPHCQQLQVRLKPESFLAHREFLEEQIGNYCPELILVGPSFSFNGFAEQLQSMRECMKALQDFGYGTDLPLTLQFDCVDIELTGQEKSCHEYLTKLLAEDELSFTSLDLRVESPIGEVKTQLETEEAYEERMTFLRRKFRADMIESLPCRQSIHVNALGDAFDCEYNLRENQHPFIHEQKIWNLKAREWIQREIWVSDHCFSCTANCRPLDD